MTLKRLKNDYFFFRILKQSNDLTENKEVKFLYNPKTKLSKFGHWISTADTSCKPCIFSDLMET